MKQGAAFAWFFLGKPNKLTPKPFSRIAHYHKHSGGWLDKVEDVRRQHIMIHLAMDFGLPDELYLLCIMGRAGGAGQPYSCNMRWMLRVLRTEPSTKMVCGDSETR